MPHYGAYTKEIFARPNGNTREGKLVAQMRRMLTNEVGGKPTPHQRMLIERAAMLQLRCHYYDQRLVDGTFTQSDSDVYLAWSNSLTRTLRELGLGEPGAAETAHTYRLAPPPEAA